jgi:hypothetical protein
LPPQPAVLPPPVNNNSPVNQNVPTPRTLNPAQESGRRQRLLETSVNAEGSRKQVNSFNAFVNAEDRLGYLADSAKSNHRLAAALEQFNNDKVKGATQAQLELDAKVVLQGFEDAGKDVRVRGAVIGIMEQLAKQLDRSDPNQATLADKILNTIKQFEAPNK